MNARTLRFPGFLLIISAVAAVLLASSAVSGQAQKESFTGFAINLNSGPSSATVDITIERWSSDEERNALLAVLTEEKDPYYPFTIAEFRLDKDEKGQGKILAGTRLLIDKNNHLVLENYGQQPVRFNEIRKLK